MVIALRGARSRWPVRRHQMIPRPCRAMTLVVSATILYASIMLISTLNWQLTTIETVTAIKPRQLHFVSVSNVPKLENVSDGKSMPLEHTSDTPSVPGVSGAGDTTDPNEVSAAVQAWLARPPAVDPQILHKRVQKAEEALDCSAATEADLRMLERLRMPPPDKDAPPSPRLLCSIYTISTQHATSVRGITDTWGKRCDGFLAMSNVTDASVPAVNVVRDGEELYENLWQKVRSMVLYLHTHHRDEFEFFLIGGEDTFVLVDNLHRLLGSDSIRQAAGPLGDQPLYLGRRLTTFNNKVFNAGGGGYVMNRAALDVLVRGIKGDQCDPHSVGTKGDDVPEDTRVGRCFAAFGVMPFDTRDEAGRERFHLFEPGYMLVSRAQPSDWLKTRSIGFKEGDDCCAPDSVSFHYVKRPEQMRAYDAFLHDQCRPDTIKNESWRVREWVQATDLSSLDVTQVRNARRNDIDDDEPMCRGLNSEDETVLRRTAVWQADPAAGQAGGRVLCVALTQSHRHDRFVRALTDTWAPQCDGFLALSDVDDPSVPSIKVQMEGEGPTRPSELWRLLGPSLLLLAKHKAMGFDWVLFVRDDTLVVMENLHMYLGSAHVQGLVGEKGEQPVVLGRRLHFDIDPAYPSLNAGFVMNRAMLETFARAIGNLECSPYQLGQDGLLLQDDLSLGACLYTLDLKAADTRDDLGRERFHPFGPSTVLARDWGGLHPYDPREGLECCSPYTISFWSEGSANRVREWHAKLHGHCGQGPSLPIPDILQDKMQDDPMELHAWLDDEPGMDPWAIQKAALPELPVHCPNASSGEHSWATHVRAIQDIPQDAATIPTILCAVLSSQNKNRTLVRGVAETWGRECDGFLAFGQWADTDLSQLHSPDPFAGMLGRRKEETSWQRAATAILYATDRHGAEFDYYLVAMDSLLVLMGSLRAQLRSQASRASGPLYLGHRQDFPSGMTFLSLEGGMLLDQAALASLAKAIRRGDCAPYRGRYVYDDMGLGECLSHSGVGALHGQDVQGRSLFHPSPPSEPLADVSPTSVAFSLAHVAPQERPAAMAALHHLMHGRCDNTGQHGRSKAGQRGGKGDAISERDMFARAALVASTS